MYNFCMEVLRLYLLGPFQVTLAGQSKGRDEPVTGFGYDKVRALLSYLAVEHHSPHSREILGSLLWPDADANTARTNLRKALSTLRKALCDTASHPYLILQNDTVQFDPEGNFWLDVDQLKSRLDATLDHTRLRFESCIHDLEEATALYRGSFLQGLTVDSLEFEEWLLTIRENLHTRMLSALHELTQYYLRQGEYVLAQKHALRQVELEPYREEAHCAIMESLAHSGQRSAALAQYERCRRILADELGIEPDNKTQLLYQRIRSAGSTRPHNLPAQQQRLVGRQVELNEIGRLLANPDCRLLTLAGIGGIGKTALALQSARERLEDFWHGVFWVPLAPLRHPGQILPAIFDALPIPPGSDPEAQLLDYLREKSILLVLDNFEHLFSPRFDSNDTAIRLINTILKDGPNVKFLVTSRERLSLRAEWVYPVEGLPCPPDGAAVNAETLERYAAIQLFVRRARQVETNFPAREDDYPHIAQICKLVGGIPLGIELASGWVDQLTCQAIAEGIEADLDFLVTSLRDMPGRHQSLRAVFEHSWKLLPAEERTVLSRLSVFRTAFSRAAAREIAQAAPHQLASLVNKSFLHLDVGGQYSLHLLLKQFLAQELAADPVEEQDTHRNHALYFSRFLKEREYALTVQYKAASLDEAGRIIEDVRAAWDWAVARKEAALLSEALEGVFIYYWARNRFAEGQAVFESALKAVEALDKSPQHQLISARLQSCIADFIFWLGDLEAAEQLLNKAIAILRTIEARQELAYALELSSRVSYWQGDYAEAEKTARSAIELARGSESLPDLAQALGTLASVICDLNGDFEAANLLYAESLALYRQLENPFGIAKVLINQGAIYYEQGNFTLAERRYQESLNHYRELNYPYGISACLNNLAMVARKLGDYERAREMIEESLALKRETGNRVAVLHSLLEIGALNTEMGNFAQARSYYCEALQMALEAQASGLIFNILLGFADYFEKTGDASRSAELTNWVLAQENIGQEAHAQAAALEASLENKLGPDGLDLCRQRANHKNADQLITELLGT